MAWDRLRAFVAQVAIFVAQPWKIPSALLGSVERDSEPEPEPEPEPLEVER
jgi:hypothetical protein